MGLILYDAYFVFGTEVMMTVAHSFNAPVKILFPTEKGAFSMVGIGDVIIPGLLVSMALRFDFIRSLIDKTKGQVDMAGNIGSASPSHSRFYFWFTLMSFNLGLLACMTVMYFYPVPQPALLYILPAMTIGWLTAGFLRKEFYRMLWYDEDDYLKQVEWKKEREI